MQDIFWYFKVKDSDKFDILKQRELTFSDEFTSDRLDTQSGSPIITGERSCSRTGTQLNLTCMPIPRRIILKSGTVSLKSIHKTPEGFRQGLDGR